MSSSPPDFAASLIESLRCGAIATDEQGRVTALNVEAQRILGGPGGPAVVGRPVEEALSGQPGVAALVRRTLVGREGLARAEMTLRGDDDAPGRTIGFTQVPVHSAQGQMRGAVLLFRDLTPIERADEQERLRDRLAALGGMAAGLAHEIRNPLAAAEVLAGLLRRRLGEAPQASLLVAELVREVRAAAATVSHTLAFVKPMEPAQGPVDLREVLEAALRRAGSAGCRAAIERHYETGLPRFEGDPVALENLFSNLVRNAIAAMQDTPVAQRRIRLGLHLHPAIEPGGAGELVASVGDAGPGVALELRERVFYPFFSSEPDGSGVGLAVAQKIAAAHAGLIEVDESSLGGALFRVRLPVRRGAQLGATS